MNNTSEEINQDDIKELVNAVKKYQDFPKQGILFYDIFSLHKDPTLNTKLFENSFKKISSEWRVKYFSHVFLQSHCILM